MKINDLQEKEMELRHQATQLDIEFIYQDKYVKGYKAVGPRNWRRANINALQYAIQNNLSKVVLWRA